MLSFFISDQFSTQSSDVSRFTEAQLSLYIRTPYPSKSGDTRDCDASSQDIFLGNVLLEPLFDDQMQDEWFPLLSGTGKVRIQLVFKSHIVSTAPFCFLV